MTYDENEILEEKLIRLRQLSKNLDESFTIPGTKIKFGIDDTLDVFSVHGVGGVIGTLLVAILGDTSFGGLGLSELGIYKQLGVQITGIIAVGLWCGVVSYILVKITAALVGLRASSEEELQGLDQTVHGESAYHK